MPMFLRLIHFTTPGLEACRKSTQDVMNRTLQAVEGCGAQVVAAFATLGTYDVVSIMSARDEEHVAQVDAALAQLGYYTIAEQAAVVDLNEFAQLSKSQPVFVTAWIQGRLAQPVDRDAGAAVKPSSGAKPVGPQLPAARAASPARRRSSDADERKGRRAPGGGAYAIWINDVGPYAVTDFTVVQGAENTVGFAMSLPPNAPALADLTKLERGAQVKGATLELIADKARVPLAAVLKRMDAASEGYTLAFEAALPRAAFLRVDRKHQELLAGSKR